MADLADIPALTRTFIGIVEETDANDDIPKWILFDSFASHYRVHAEASAEIVLDDLEGYPDIQQLLKIQEAQEELGLEPYHRREALRYYRDWAYRYGAKQSDPETPVPEITYREGVDEPHASIQMQAEDIVRSGEATANDLALVFRLADEHLDKNRRGGEFKDPEVPLLEFYDRVYEQVADLYELKSPDINWNLMGGLFDTGSNLADRDAMEALGKRKGRREVIDELRETDLTLEEWLAEQE